MTMGVGVSVRWFGKDGDRKVGDGYRGCVV